MVLSFALLAVAGLTSPGPVPSALFDTKASLVFGTGAGEQQNLFVTNLGWMVRFIPQGTWPGPAMAMIGFTSDGISTPDWSKDNGLVLARGSRSQDVVLFDRVR